MAVNPPELVKDSPPPFRAVSVAHSAPADVEAALESAQKDGYALLGDPIAQANGDLLLIFHRAAAAEA